MEIFPLLVIGLIFVGIWGTMIVSARVKQISDGSGPGLDDRILRDFQETTRLLEARLEQVEEELAFYRELRAPDASAKLPSPGAGGAVGSASASDPTASG